DDLRQQGQRFPVVPQSAPGPGRPCIVGVTRRGPILVAGTATVCHEPSPAGGTQQGSTPLLAWQRLTGPRTPCPSSLGAGPETGGCRAPSAGRPFRPGSPPPR